MDRTAVINFLVTNCDCWKGKEKVLANKETFTDEDLNKLKAGLEKTKQMEIVANAAKAGFEHGDTGFVFNETSGKWEPKPKTLTASTTTSAVVNTTTVQATKPITDAEWLASAPPGIQAAVRNAMEIEQRERTSIITSLTANSVSEELRKAAAAVYEGMTLPQLRQLAAAIPQSQTHNKVQAAQVPSIYQSTPIYQSAPVMYLGAGHVGVSSTTQVQNRDDDDPDYLPLPVMNYEEIANERDEQRAVHN